MRRAVCRFITVISGILVFQLPARAEMANPAHLLAQKFAQDAEKPATAAPAAKPPVATAAPVKPAFKRPPAPGPDYEQEMLNAARAEADARRMAQQPPGAQPSAPATAAAMPETRTSQETKPAAAATPAPPAVTAPAASTASPPATTPIKSAAAPATSAPASAATATAGSPAHVSVLLVLDPQLSSSEQAGSQPAPVICIGDDCYISAGADGAAHPRTRTEAAGVVGVSGDCLGKTHCIFRNVTLKAGADFQILDTTFGKAGASKPVEVHADKSCAVSEGELDCELTISGVGYRAWLVPETVAASTTPLILESALATDLIEDNETRADDR